MIASPSKDPLSKSHKRKRPARVAQESDEDLYDAVLHSDLDDGGDTGLSGDDVASDEAIDEPGASTGKVIDIEALSKLNRKIDKTGIVYISRIPPGMGPAKLKHILSQFGETDRVYLARDPKDTRKQSARKKNGKEKHQAHRFVEGWVEFLDKRKAKATAELLNAKPIGGKPSSPFYSDIWTMKYLPRFKWSMLSALNAQQRASEQALLRNEISQSKKAQSDYLSQVERARVLRKADEKKAASRAARSLAPGQEDETLEKKKDDTDKPEKPAKQHRIFKQRPTIKASDKAVNSKQATLNSVLDNLI